MVCRHLQLLVCFFLVMLWALLVIADYRSPKSISSRLPDHVMASQLFKQSEEARSRYGITGAYVGLISGDKFFGTGLGHADAAGTRKIDENTVFNIGSVSKPVAAWGVLALVDDGLIGLDDPVEIHLSQWHFPTGKFDPDMVTVKQLLQHTAGTSVYGYDGYPSLTEPDQRPFREIEQAPLSLAESASKDYPVRIVRQPGNERFYSGGGYSVLQMMVEDITGKPFADFMNDRIFKRLNMTESAYDGRNSSFRSSGFDYAGRTLPDLEFRALAAAALYSSGSDMRTFLDAQLNSGGGALSPEMRKFMLEPVAVNNGFATSYTRGKTASGVLYGHGGNNSAWHAQIYFMPERKQGFFFLTNSTTGAQFEIDISCSWKSWLIGKPAGAICADSFALTRNLSLATFFTGLVAILLACYAYRKIRVGKRALKILPGGFGLWGNLSRYVGMLIVIILIFAFVAIFYSDFIYTRSGVVLFDEIPLHEIRLMAIAIFMLLLSVLTNISLSKSPAQE